jgi:hypothetical protein
MAISLTDPQAAWTAFRRIRSIFAYHANYLLDHKAGIGMPPLKWSTNWDSFIPQFGGPGDGWKAREARRYRIEAAAG